MVVKRKKDSKEVVPATPESKRTKVQAQRKFAQGQQAPQSAYLTYNVTSGSETPVKEKSQEKELLPNLRPNTEDFLTFLCYRGTNNLPKNLDFQNRNNPSQPSTSGGASTSTGNKTSPEKKKSETKNESKKKKAKIEKKIEEPDVKPSTSTSEKDPKTGFIPFAVRKRAEFVPEKNDKKKQQQNNKKKQQSLSNGKESPAGTKASRSNDNEESPLLVDDKTSAKKGNKRKSKVANDDSVTSFEKSPLKTPKLDKSTKVEVKLPEKAISETSRKEEKSENKNKSPKKEEEKRRTRMSAPRNYASHDDDDDFDYEDPKYFSSDDDEPLMKPVSKTKKQEIAAKIEVPVVENPPVEPKKRGRKKLKPSPEVEVEVQKEQPELEVKSSEKKKVGRKKKIVTIDPEVAENSQANTTDLSENEARGRPTRKTKEAATIYMELIGRKLTLDNSSDNDASSLDSLEAPNYKKMALLESEMRANLTKTKDISFEIKRDEKKIFPKTTPDIKIFKEQRALTQDEVEVAELMIDSGNGDLRKLEKSFSDSDEEPLATKVVKQPKKPTPKKRGRKSAVELAEIASAAAEVQRKCDEINRNKMIESMTPRTIEIIKIPLETPPAPKLSIPPKMEVNEHPVRANEMLQKLKTPDVSVMRQSKIPEQPLKIKVDSVQVEDDDFVRGFDSPAIPSAATKVTSINLLPSKEESEKIFGIASVTLAQSSGPLDTKCTLGKCGSIHKPPLGPAVLTESALGASLSPKDRRKSKVNMTREQIQKWLDETSWTPIPDEDDYMVDLKIVPKSSGSYMATKSNDDSQSSSKLLDRPSPSTSSRGPTLKAKPVALKSEIPLETPPPQKKIPLKQEEKREDVRPLPALIKSTEVKKTPETTEKRGRPPGSTNKAKESDKKPAIYNQQKQQQQQQQQLQQQQQQLRTPVYKTMDKPKLKSNPMLNSFGAFSPENEHSVYSFDREDDDLPTPTTPFRQRRSRQNSINSKPDEKKEPETFQKPLNYNTTPSKQTIPPAQVSLTLSPEDKKSASVAVEMGQEKEDDKDKRGGGSREKDDNDSESIEENTYYIPLQVSNTGCKTIQGVAVKLGTEGDAGPNQRIIMHAKLVTKSRSNAAPLPESMNVQELVKTLMASKDGGSKPVPCATVQPRFKSNDEHELTQQNEPVPSTSASSSAARNNKQLAPKLATQSEAPIFRPSEEEFQDPIEYIERITPLASRFGICRIIPPSTFKPECRVSDEMRFTAYNQYVHKMLHRWGPSSKEFSAIKKYLATQSINFQRPPLIAGLEVDLPRLYHTVQELGGLREVIEKKKWAKVAEDMCIPKTAHDRATKLDDIYCKYLLPYDTLSPTERQKLFDDVEADWAKREAKARRTADKCVESDEQSNEEESEEEDDDEEDDASMECMVKGRSMPLSQFFRIARNTMALWFKTAEPTVSEIEAEYWRHVAVRDSHVCVHYGSIDSSGYGYGFPVPGPKTKLSPCSKHPWNLKVLTNNSGSILRSLGPVMGVTVPTLHVGMLFSAVCWYRDPHGLPWIEYLHTGASKIWYAVPNEQSANFRSALTSLVPSHCQNKTIWLPCDTAMVPPYMLTDRNVSLCRTEQLPGEFVVVFPRAYTSSVCTGYTVSESVYFATKSWLDTAHLDFKDIQESSEPTMFSLEQLLFAIANDQRTNDDTLTKMLPMMDEVFDNEKSDRQALKDAGVTRTEKIHEAKNKVNAEELECNYCRANLHISWIKLTDDDEETVYCLKHSLKYLNDNRIQANQCKLLYTYTIEEIEKLIQKLRAKLAPGMLQGQSSSFAGNSQQKNRTKGNQKIKGSRI